MRSFSSFLAVFLGMSAAFLLQQFRVFSLFGVNPNLLLLGFLTLVFLRAAPWIAFVFLAVFLLLVYVQMPFWFLEGIALALLVLVVVLVKKFLTGYSSVDFFISLILGTAVFYGIVGVMENISALGLGFREYHFSIPHFLVKEMVYNAFLGSIFWALFHKKKLT